MRPPAAPLLAALLLAVSTLAPAAPPEPRRFRMGFTGFVPDLTLEAVTASRRFVKENGDLIAHHIEGVPWAETLREAAFPPKLTEEWNGKKASTPPRGKVYLAVSPGRGDLKVAEKCAPLPAELRGKSYRDPLVKKVYLAYCRRAIGFFKPDYLCIGIEVNEIHGAGTEKWEAYLDLHRHVYQALKKEHPRLPVFASFTLHSLFKERAALEGTRALVSSWCDLTAVSYYPFLVPDEHRLAALDWLLKEFDPVRKPYAFVETNDAAERHALPQLGAVIEGTPERQLEYYRRLLALAQEKRFEFVVSFVHQDYDRLWQVIRSQAPELFGLWRDCGLLDERGQPRPALAEWKQWHSRKLGTAPSFRNEN